MQKTEYVTGTISTEDLWTFSGPTVKQIDKQKIILFVCAASRMSFNLFNLVVPPRWCGCVQGLSRENSSSQANKPRIVQTNVIPVLSLGQRNYILLPNNWKYINDGVTFTKTKGRKGLVGCFSHSLWFLAALVPLRFLEVQHHPAETHNTTQSCLQHTPTFNNATCINTMAKQRWTIPPTATVMYKNFSHSQRPLGPDASHEKCFPRWRVGRCQRHGRWLLTFKPGSPMAPGSPSAPVSPYIER